jgi:hypothetical protein
MKYALALLLCSCSATPFFGATVQGKYTTHYDGKLECAVVVGWADDGKPTCMCRLTDPAFSEDKTFIKSPYAILCEVSMGNEATND